MRNKEVIKLFFKKLQKEKLYHRKKFLQLKREFAKIYKLPLFTNITLLAKYRQMIIKGELKRNERILKILKRREIRTLSGVSIITVLTKPYPCPGICLYCPSEIDMPKSYLKNEPAAQRAYLNKFDPFKQVKMRLEALGKIGHATDKIELIILGGSWTAYPKKYKTWFVKRCFDAANKKTVKTLEQAQKLNEKAKNRIIGLSLETRPDLVTEKEAMEMRRLGCTRVELGVQSIYNEVLKKNKRGHQEKQIIKATKILKNLGFKIIYHMMPNLLGSTPKKDLQMFKTIFSVNQFQPDMLKIYPCVVLKSAMLYKLWLKKKYRPYSQKTLNHLLVNIKKIIPPYVRINRLIRDIPSTSIEAGNKITNLRQVLHQKEVICQCIRCREARQKKINEKDLIFVKRKYKASEGDEYFLSFESLDKKTLYAFLRLRLSKDNYQNSAMIRELHTYGELVPLKSKNKKIQHIGLGKRLMKKAEKIAIKKNYIQIVVISGIGVRDYYRHLGYRLKKTYMYKKASQNLILSEDKV